MALASIPEGAFAQSIDDPQAEIVVTGRGLADAPGDRVYDIVTIDRDRIVASASNRLESVLADVAGLQQFRRADSRSANASNQGVTLRGLGGNASSRALLILDGVPQADPFGGWIAFPAYATGRIGRVRVTRGGGSGYGGPGALAGTIELDSATPDQLTPLQAALAYGSRDSLDAQGSAALVRGGGFMTVSGAYARGDGFVPIVATSRGPADRPARYEQASGAVRTVIDLGGATELQANVTAFTDTRERGLAFTTNSSKGGDASVRLVGRGRWGWSALGYLQARAFTSSAASVNATRSLATQTLDQYSTPSTGLGGRIEVAPPIGGGVEVRLGADIRALDGRTQERYTYVAAQPTRLREAGGASRTIGGFVDASVELGTVTLTAGGRLDAWRITGGRLVERTIATGAALTDSVFADRSGTEATGRAGVAWRPGTPVSLRAAAYRGWRLPTLNELYRPFRVGVDATAANAALSPERLTGVEGGVDLRPVKGMTLSLTGYYNRLTDAIANVTAGRGAGTFAGVGFVAAGGIYRIRQNLDAVEAKGLELDAAYTVGIVTARASWAHTDSRVVASGVAAVLDGLRPAQTPENQVSATLGFARDGAAFSATVRHVGRQFEDDQNSRTLAPATTLDAYAAVPVAGGFAVELRGENVTDARIEAGVSGANIVERASPRTLWVGLRYAMR
ncbi:TonB-dependent receptor [Sphingomonas sp. Leaf17]|uniref:TonB-dependent receptor n=1 Tax=Sphingomonas sp. Leaf17 TaxID=1735683 RepID=UPI0006FCD4E9|nr:TonB-dependent receptor [Sphingomonas sp. Leaf17]KQM63226.1 TonB-dependent receptor [Sphingomonas sp. Leaf17]